MVTLISPSAAELLSDRITTQEQVIVAIWFCTNVGDSYTAEVVAVNTGITPKDTEDALASLVDCKLLERGDDRPHHYWYAPESVEVHTQLRALAEAYARQPGEVRRVLTRKALERLRDSSSADFVPGTAFRKKPDE